MDNRLTQQFAIFLALLLIVTLSGCSMTGDERPQTAQATPQPRQVDLFYATDRAPAADGDLYFSGIRGDLSYGIAEISIPPDHVMGEHEEPSLLKLEWSPEEDKHISVRDVLKLNREAFISRLGRAVEASPDNKLMVFVHGYNEEFPDTSRRVAQFANDLKFSAPVVLFSWPSQGGLTGYTVDETNAEWAQAHFVELMSYLLEQLPVHSIYVVGHSMGNRIIGSAMITLSGDRLEKDLGSRNVGLADVDMENMDAPALGLLGVGYELANGRPLHGAGALGDRRGAAGVGSAVFHVDGSPFRTWTVDPGSIPLARLDRHPRHPFPGEAADEKRMLARLDS